MGVWPVAARTSPRRSGGAERPAGTPIAWAERFQFGKIPRCPEDHQRVAAVSCHGSFLRDDVAIYLSRRVPRWAGGGAPSGATAGWRGPGGVVGRGAVWNSDQLTRRRET